MARIEGIDDEYFEYRERKKHMIRQGEGMERGRRNASAFPPYPAFEDADRIEIRAIEIDGRAAWSIVPAHLVNTLNRNERLFIILVSGKFPYIDIGENRYILVEKNGIDGGDIEGVVYERARLSTSELEKYEELGDKITSEERIGLAFGDIDTALKAYPPISLQLSLFDR